MEFLKSLMGGSSEGETEMGGNPGMDNVLAQILGQQSQPSFMQPSAPQPQQSYGQPQPQQNVLSQMSSSVPERKRMSALDIVGGLADAFASMGGSEPMYQPSLDAATQRRRQAETDSLEQRKAGLNERIGDTSIRGKQLEYAGMAVEGLKKLFAERGPDGVRQAMPQVAQMFGLPDDMRQFIENDPEQGIGMLEGLLKTGDNEYYGTPVVYSDEQGNQHLYQLSKDGGMREVMPNEGQAYSPKLQFNNLGTTIQPTNPYTGQSPPGLAQTVQGSPATGDMAISDPNAPGGFRYDQAPGSQAAKEQEQKSREQAEKEAKFSALAAKTRGQAVIVRDSIGRAIKLAEDSWSATGLPGQVSQMIGGTPARNLSALLEPIKSNISIDNLMEMRANSPTGGALGNVSDKDIALLASTIASLDTAQSQKQFLENLNIIDGIYSRIQQGLAPGQRKSLSSPPSGQSPPAPASGDGWSIQEVQ